MLSILGINTAFAENTDLTVYIIDTGEFYEFSNTRHGEYYMQFMTKPEADGSYWMMCIDIWADQKNQGSITKGILPTGTYNSATTHDADAPAGATEIKGTFYSSCSWVRHYVPVEVEGSTEPEFVVEFERELPESITITRNNGNSYNFSIVVSDDEGNTYTFGLNQDVKGNEENIPFEHYNYSGKNGNPGMTYEEFVKENSGDNEKAPARPTGIDTIDADSDAQIAFDGYNIRLGNTENVIVVDITGRICLQTKSDNVDVSGLNNGFYIAKAGKQTLKFYKK